MTDGPKRAPAPPPRYKLALVTWIGVYPIITGLLAVLGPATATWPLPLRTLLLTAVNGPNPDMAGHAGPDARVSGLARSGIGHASTTEGDDATDRKDLR